MVHVGLLPTETVEAQKGHLMLLSPDETVWPFVVFVFGTEERAWCCV